MSAIDRIHKLVRPGESVKFTLSGEDDRVCVVIEPQLAKRADEGDSVPERAQLLAVLSQPIRFHVRSDEDIDSALSEVLDRVEPARVSGYSALDELLASLSDASAGARNRATNTSSKKAAAQSVSGTSKGGASKSTQDDTPAPPAPDTGTGAGTNKNGLFD
jgi:PRTRC genetic system protein E